MFLDLLHLAAIPKRLACSHSFSQLNLCFQQKNILFDKCAQVKTLKLGGDRRIVCSAEKVLGKNLNYHVRLTNFTYNKAKREVEAQHWG